ncbi:MAG: 4-alpha-glucanotransferase [Lachnospiraceae bacterium]|jgi:4-alpha-glucanotransferase|nr:4-alpha-glucanotransferase [Lachnospiraceae bacterium]MCI1327410.1 4-alpha-glucanotransferase [Lachnospiraceae bacterium]
MRSAGILLPISSLPTRYGIGGFSEEAYAFADRLWEAGQKIWQILPLVPTGFGDSPYQSFSTFAGNPYLISLDELCREGLLTGAECREADAGDDPRYVNFGRVYRTRFAVLGKAFERFSGDAADGYGRFLEENREWLSDYALFMAIKEELGGIPWTDWPEPLRLREEKAIRDKRGELSREIAFQCFLQYEFDVQWKKLKRYVNGKGIRIFGDMPIYVAMDSADAWAEPKLFQFNEDLVPENVAGCPPDGFTADGQLWGNPLHNWDYQKRTGYAWWIRRMRRASGLYDIVRIDHFRGFESYYSIPYTETTARNGVWRKGPGIDVFRAVREACGEVSVVAEDLGYLTDDVRKMVRDSGYPGMKVLHFAFGSDSQNEYLPHHYEKNCVVYTGTQDNDTSRGYFESASAAEIKFCLNYLGHPDCREEEFAWTLIRAALASVGDTAIIPMQDYLNLGTKARMNIPSTQGGLNWRWRMLPGEFDAALAGRIREVTRLYSR